MSEVFQVRLTAMGEAGNVDAYHPPQPGDKTLSEAISAATNRRLMPSLGVQLTKGAVRLFKPEGDELHGSPLRYLDVRTIFFGDEGDDTRAVAVKYSARLQVDPDVGNVRIARKPIS